MVNECGDCTFCCFLLPIPELDKPHSKWCPECEVGKGCASYETRPGSCKEFNCLWVTSGTDASLRPDKCKVMLEPVRGSRTILAISHPKRPDAWKSGSIRRVLHALMESGTPVVVTSYSKAQKHVFVPKGVLKERIEQELKASLEGQYGSSNL